MTYRVEKTRGEGIGSIERKTHLLIHEPAAVLSSLLRLGDPPVDFEMPIHVGGFPLLALGVRGESTPTLAALGP